MERDCRGGTGTGDGDRGWVLTGTITPTVTFTVSSLRRRVRLQDPTDCLIRPECVAERAFGLQDEYGSDPPFSWTDGVEVTVRRASGPTHSGDRGGNSSV